MEQIAVGMKQIEVFCEWSGIPIVSHWIDAENNDWIIALANVDYGDFTWHVFSVSKDALIAMKSAVLENAISLRSAILTSPNVFELHGQTVSPSPNTGELTGLRIDIASSIFLPRQGSYMTEEACDAWEQNNG